MNAGRLALALPVVAALAWLLAWSSAVPVRWHADNATELRLSWSARPERLEVCRELSDAELAERPSHMQRRIECEGGSATYALSVRVDDLVVDDEVIHGAGLRRDRPIFMLRRYSVVEGEHRVRVAFMRREARDSLAARRTSVDSLSEREARTDDDREARERRERRGRDHAAIPPALALDTVVTFARGGVVLVTYADGAFVVRTP